MSEMVNMISRALDAFQNADPVTRKIFFWVFVVLIALTIAEQLYL